MYKNVTFFKLRTFSTFYTNTFETCFFMIFYHPLIVLKIDVIKIIHGDKKVQWIKDKAYYGVRIIKKIYIF